MQPHTIIECFFHRIRGIKNLTAIFADYCDFFEALTYMRDCIQFVSFISPVLFTLQEHLLRLFKCRPEFRIVIDRFSSPLRLEPLQLHPLFLNHSTDIVPGHL